MNCWNFKFSVGMCRYLLATAVAPCDWVRLWEAGGWVERARCAICLGLALYFWFSMRFCSTRAWLFSMLSRLTSLMVSSMCALVRKVLVSASSSWRVAPMTGRRLGSSFSLSTLRREMATLRSLFLRLASRACQWKNSFSSISILSFSFQVLMSLLSASSFCSYWKASLRIWSMVTSSWLMRMSLKLLLEFFSLRAAISSRNSFSLRFT
mmetsp:Transcript_9236/g.15532  ORF Transcript_9236/g.15532 Transcript_9236/m.15532 type:complete len:209 (+) Transcript_9236:1021-1647(+)